MKVDQWLRRIAWFEPFWVLVVGAITVVPPRFAPAVLQPYAGAWRPFLIALLLLGWPIRALAYRRLTQRTPLDWPLLIIVLWLPVNLWASLDKAMSWRAVGFLVFGIALYFALVNWPPTQRRPQLIAWFILLIGAGLVLVAPLLSELPARKLFAVLQFESTFKQLAMRLPGNVNANVIGGIMAMILPLYISMSLRWDWTGRRWLPVLLSLATVCMLAALILSQSRGAYLGVGVAIIVILALRWPPLRYVVPLALVVAGAAVLRTGLQSALATAGSGTALDGLDARLEVWSRGLYALHDFAFTGIGIGTFDQVIPLLYPYFLIGPDNPLHQVHNLLLQVGLDLGLPGLVAYLALLINTFVLLAKVLGHRNDALAWTLAAGVLGGLVAMLVHGILDTPVWGASPAVLFWLFIVLAVQLGLRTAEFELSSAAATSAAAGGRNVALPKEAR